MDLKNIIAPMTWENLPGEFYSSVISLLIVLILALVIRIKLKDYDPLKAPKGFLWWVEQAVNFADEKVKELMGPMFEGFGAYVLVLAAYIAIGFLVGFFGFPDFFTPQGFYDPANASPLPNPFTNTSMPLAIALCTFLLTHFTAAKCNKWGYFKRYIKPFPFFLPINLITMWSPLLSLTLRLFGNALAGYCVVTLIYVGFAGMLPVAGTGLAITPVIAPLIHLYFDVFDGFIQLVVFCMLTMINISMEYVTPAQLAEEKRDREEKKRLKAEKRAARQQKREAKRLHA